MGISLFDTTPAITQMMGLLGSTPPGAQQGPPQPPPVTPQQMPQFAPPPPVHGRLVDRLHNRLQGLLDSVKPTSPDGYGLLSDAELEKAKPGRLESLIERVAGFGSDVFTKQAHQENIDRVLKMKEYASAVGQQKNILQTRQQLVDLFPPPPNETPVQLHKRLAAMGAFAVQHGDLESAKSIGETIKSLHDNRFQVAGGSLIDLNDPDNPKVINGQQQAVPRAAAPAVPHNAPIGSPERLKYEKDLAEFRASLRASGGSAGGQESAMNVSAKARLTAAVSEMNNAHDSMHQYENDIASGKVKVGAPSQLLQRIANSFTHDDPASMILQSASLAALDRADPPLARYIRRGLSFAEGESMISGRPSDFRTKMAAFLSTAASGASPEMIHDIQSRRQSILTPLNSAVEPSTPKGNGSATGSKGKKTYTYGGKTYTVP